MPSRPICETLRSCDALCEKGAEAVLEFIVQRGRNLHPPLFISRKPVGAHTQLRELG